ncbi:MAG: hypothetical protein KBG41_00295, partial [Thiobacillaceae bacterium]|nr:hypothetical protein [Thiobacillaceae bacterium]
MKRIVALLAAVLLAGSGGAAELESFTPQGEHLQARQVQTRFSAAMVPQGRANAPAPFDIQCGVEGNAYWSDERTWVFDLTGDLKAGEPCRFLPRPGLATLAGEAVKSAPEYRFAVAGPRVVWMMPSSPSTIDEDQVFVLRLNGAARPEDLQAGVRCEIQGIHEQVAARRLAGAERTRLLRSIAQVLKDQGEPWDARNPESEATLEVVQCVRTLPANARMALVWGRGIATPSGQTNP